MEFESEAQRQAYERVIGWARELFGEFANVHDTIPSFAIFMGSALIETTVHSWRDGDDALIITRSYVVGEIEPDPELFHYLLRNNGRFIYGGFGLTENNDVVFSHSLLASACDKETLGDVVKAVVSTADHFDDEITSRWGGVRVKDRMEKLQQ